MAARIARMELLYGDCYAHVISRSIRGLKIFKDNSDFETFKNLLLVEKRRSKFKIYHYCLMHTHFHLVVRIADVLEFSRSLLRLKSRYVSVFHEKYRLNGPIWRSRYKSLLIENEGYLLVCGKYVEENPVEAGLVQCIEDWEHSSGKHYMRGYNDKLVDDYEDMEQARHVNVEEGVKSSDFEKGSLIGSSFFKFQFFDRRRRC